MKLRRRTLCAVLAGGGLLAGCEVSLFEPHFGQDVAVTPLGDDRWEVRALDHVSQEAAFRAAEETCGASVSVQDRQVRPDDPGSVYYTVRCMRPPPFPPPRDARPLPPVLRQGQ